MNNDTWDLATSVGATATMVAAARAVATNSVCALINDPFAQPLVSAVGIDFFTRWATGGLAAADLDTMGAPWGLQRIVDMLIARTRFFDAFFLGAAASGIRQAVILASGLDARSYRLEWPPGTTVYEIDQPKVIEFKNATLTELGVHPTARLRSVAVDLREDWANALLEAGFEVDRPTAWIAEGLLAYLSPVAQDRLLDTITKLSAGKSRLAVETFSPTDDVKSDGTDATMQTVMQVWRDNGLSVELDDLAHNGARSDLATFLDGRGWQSDQVALRQLLAANGLPAAKDAGAVAENYYCTSVLSL